MKCNKCSFENKAETKFCIKCDSPMIEQKDDTEILNENNKKNNKDENVLLGLFGLLLICFSFINLSFALFRTFTGNLSYCFIPIFYQIKFLYMLQASFPLIISFFVRKIKLKKILMILGIINFAVSLLYTILTY